MRERDTDRQIMRERGRQNKRQTETTFTHKLRAIARKRETDRYKVMGEGEREKHRGRQKDRGTENETDKTDVK